MAPSYRTGQHRRLARQHQKLARLVPHTHSVHTSQFHQPDVDAGHGLTTAIKLEETVSLQTRVGRAEGIASACR